jgi:hypothetical protein
MKLLSAKNKKMGILAFAILGAALIAGVIYKSVKSGATSAGDIGSSVWSWIKSSIGINSFLIVAAAAAFMFPSDGFATQAVLLGVLTTGVGVVTTFNTTYLPKLISYTAATQLTGLKITVQGEGVIFDSDANGLNHAGVNRLQGQLTNSYTFRLTNGLITGKNIIWEFTNSAAQTPSIYVDNDETQADGDKMYLQFLRQAVLANSGQNFSDFATLSLPSLSATDYLNVFYRDGTQQTKNRQDVLAMLQYTQNVVNTPVYMLDNFGQVIKMVNVMVGVAQTAYVQRWVPSGLGMVNQAINN